MRHDNRILLLLAFRSALAGAWVFLSLLVFVPVAGVALLVDRRQRLQDWFAIVWARGILFVMGMRVSCRGIDHIKVIEHEMEEWLVAHEYDSLVQLKGSMSQKNCPDPDAFERAQYVRGITTSWQPLKDI